MLVSSADTIGVAEGLAVHLVLYGRGAGYHIPFDVRGKEHAVAPDHRRSVAASGHGRLPGDIVVTTPGGREVLQRGEAIGGRAAPSRPIVQTGGAAGDGGNGQE